MSFSGEQQFMSPVLFYVNILAFHGYIRTPLVVTENQFRLAQAKKKIYDRNCFSEYFSSPYHVSGTVINIEIQYFIKTHKNVK